MPENRSIRVAALVILFSLICVTGNAQFYPQANPPGEIKLALEKMQVLGSVLYVGAHPDDENNALLAYFAKGAKYRTAYLAATRGDGGQNHIGDEQHQALGILRTQELLAARRIDGAEQFFSRAIDFGYTSSVDETLEKWGHEEILADFVWVIRRFRPDIIITRFPTTGEGIHGHHTASAILASEAFRAAGDPQRFPEQLKYVQPWQPKRLFWNAFIRGMRTNKNNPNAMISIDIGAYNPLLGASYTEIGAEARSMHKCQGMGTSKSRGPAINDFALVDGDPAAGRLFSGIDTTWSRVPGSEAAGRLLAEANAKFDIAAPHQSVDLLLQVDKMLAALPQNNWVTYKRTELHRLIQACLGLWLEAAADAYAVAPGGELQLTVTAVNRSPVPVDLRRIGVVQAGLELPVERALPPNQPYSQTFKITVPPDAGYTQPYWLREPAEYGRFRVPEQRLVGMPENEPALQIRLQLSIAGAPIAYKIPVTYRWRDQFDGDRYRPLEIVPEVSANFEEPAYIFPDAQSRDIHIRLQSGIDLCAGYVRLDLPPGWHGTPERQPFSLPRREDEKLVTFRVTPPTDQSIGQFRAVVTLASGKELSRSLVRIRYKHIPYQSYFPPAESKAVRIDLRRNSEKIGYIMGAGDKVAQSLAQIGYEVTLLSDEELESGDLSRFDTIITGVRAYSTRERLRQLHARLLAFVEQGGTLIVQYNSHQGNYVDQLGPYPMELSRGRVDDETAPVEMINPAHPLLNVPNKITAADFEGWVHDRGLYFAVEWDDRYETILSSHDKGKPPLEGGLLYTRYGKGVFIYAAYSFFRQLPAGVPGAYRLLVNLISARP